MSCSLKRSQIQVFFLQLLHIVTRFCFVPPQKSHVGISHRIYLNCFRGVVVSVLTSRAVDHEFELRTGQTKDYEIGICCFSSKHAALRRKSKDWLARNQDNVSDWSDMSIC